MTVLHVVYSSKLISNKYPASSRKIVKFPHCICAKGFNFHSFSNSQSLIAFEIQNNQVKVNQGLARLKARVKCGKQSCICIRRIPQDLESQVEFSTGVTTCDPIACCYSKASALLVCTYTVQSGPKKHYIRVLGIR